MIRDEIQAILSMNYIEITDCAKFTEEESGEKPFLKVSNPLPTSVPTWRKTGGPAGTGGPGHRGCCCPGQGGLPPPTPGAGSLRQRADLPPAGTSNHRQRCG